MPSTAAGALVRARPGAAPTLRAAGAVPVAPELRIWRVADRELPRLRRHGAIAYAERNQRLYSDASTALPLDPLESTEWWRPIVGADAVDAPGPGKPVTIVDSGLDMTHPEFASRPNTVTLNEQALVLDEDDHGTEVGSVVGAPRNGIGVVGIYPQAFLRSWDASPIGFITSASAVAGIVAASKGGPGVINISFGSDSPEPLIRAAILYAIKRGSLVVASAGNDGLSGNPLSYPASYPHVLTVGATDQAGTVSSFSSQSIEVDLAAPGTNISVAEPLSYDTSGYTVSAGTSFSAPMVAGAAGWVWTRRPTLDNTQLFDVMRMSAHDLAPAGYDRGSGFGLLDIPAALAAPTPLRDPLEPNDDIDEVRAHAIFESAATPLTTPSRRATTITARVDRREDPHDVYRAFVPGGRALVVRTTARTVETRIFGPGATSVLTAAPAAVHTGAGSVLFRNVRRTGVYVYVDVRPLASVPRTQYTLRLNANARR